MGQHGRLEPFDAHRAGTAEQFIAAFHGIKHVFDEIEGFHSIRMTHCVESPDRLVLLVEWDSVEAHERNFRGSEAFGQWRAAVGPFFAGAPLVEHFVDV